MPLDLLLDLWVPPLAVLALSIGLGLVGVGVLWAAVPSLFLAPVAWVSALVLFTAHLVHAWRRADVSLPLHVLVPALLNHAGRRLQQARLTKRAKPMAWLRTPRPTEPVC